MHHTRELITHREDVTGDSLAAWAVPGAFVAALQSALRSFKKVCVTAGYFFACRQVSAVDDFPLHIYDEHKIVSHGEPYRKNDIPSTLYPPCLSILPLLLLLFAIFHRLLPLCAIGV